MKLKRDTLTLLLFAMRISFTSLIWVFLLVSNIYANKVDAQKNLEKVFTLSVDNMSIEKAVERVGNITKVRFVFSSSATEFDKKISFKLKEIKLIDFLNQQIIPNGISFQEVNNSIVLFPVKSKGLLADISTISTVNSEDLPVGVVINGTVKDENGTALEGATVQEKGTNNKTASNKKGGFSIKVKDSHAVLEISYVGYSFKQVFTNGENTFNITLTSTAKSLENVVIVDIGYQKVRKSDVTGSVSKLSTE